MSLLNTSARVLAVLLVGIAPVACAEDPTEPRPDPASLVAEIRFAVDDALGLYAGESGALGAVAYDSAGAAIADAPIELTVSDDDVIALDSTGAFTALAQGTATITASVGEVAGSVIVRVTDFVQISIKADPLCARDVDGAVWCVGTDWRGQVSWPHPMYETWTKISGDLVFSSLASGYQHTCGIAGGSAYCWGSNEIYELGNAEVSMSSSEPVPVDEQPGFETIAAGWEHSCGIAVDGAAYCWGRNMEGQHGNGHTGFAVMSAVAGGHTWRAVDPGWWTTCGVNDDDGLVYCWGDANLDSTRAVPAAHPAVPQDLENLATLGGGCGSKGTVVYCWTWDEVPTEPTAVDLGGEVADLALGDESVCALLESGEIRCWGDNARWLLGDSTLVSSATPVTVGVEGRTFVALTGELSRHCALADDGGVYCWGRGEMVDRPFPGSAEPTRVAAPLP